MPGRFWKWRMRSAAMEAARLAGDRGYSPDLWVCGSLMDVAHFKALLGRKAAPVAVFFHEAQASYPPKGGEVAERDYQYLMTDLASAGAADAVWFNTASLRDVFLRETRAFLARMPDTRPLWLLDEIAKKTRILHLGMELSGLLPPRTARERPLRVLWPHRWEHDKNPEEFFGVMEELKAEGVDFRLLVAGGRYSRAPEVFARAALSLADRVDHWGEVKERGEYENLLGASDVVVSTSLHETFGMAMVEAACAGAHPLAPRRLCYPEVLPHEIHTECLYEDAEDLRAKLKNLLTGENAPLDGERLRRIFLRYDWKNRVADFDLAALEASQTPG